MAKKKRGPVAGINSPMLKNGRYSKYLPKNIQKNYEELLSDPEILDLSHEIALLQALHGELIEEISAGGSKNNWKALHMLWDDFKLAVANGDSEEQTEAMINIDEFFVKATERDKGLTQLQGMSDTIRKLAKEEQNRRIQNQTMIGVEQVMVLVYAALASLKQAAFAHAEPALAERIIEDASKRHRELIGARKDSGWTE